MNIAGLFQKTPMQREALFLKDNQKPESKLETETIGGVTRHYIVLADGTRLLVAESKELEHVQLSNSEKQPSQTEELMQYLNHLLGTGHVPAPMINKDPR